MSNYELGNTEPKLSLLCEISKFFRISIDDFLLKDIEAEKITPVVTETAPPETANNNFRELLDVLRKRLHHSRNGRGNRDAQTDNYTT